MAAYLVKRNCYTFTDEGAPRIYGYYMQSSRRPSLARASMLSYLLSLFIFSFVLLELT